LSYFLRGRSKEILGVHHMKLYMFDSTLLISGANLSQIYFEQRQDRYIEIRNNQPLVDFFTTILHTISSSPLTCQLSKSQLTIREPSPSDSEKQQLSYTLNQFTLPPSTPKSEIREANTWLFPTIQLGFLDVRQDETLSRLIFGLSCNPTLHLDIASGYCNFTNEHLRTILAARGQVDVITPSPEANGFWGAKGLSRFITGAYDFFSRSFLDHVTIEQKKKVIRLFEYFREGWSFHAKGAWIRPDVPTPGGPF